MPIEATALNWTSEGRSLSVKTHVLNKELKLAEARIKAERSKEKEAITRLVEEEFEGTLKRREIERQEAMAEAAWQIERRELRRQQ